MTEELKFKINSLTEELKIHTSNTNIYKEILKNSGRVAANTTIDIEILAGNCSAVKPCEIQLLGLSTDGLQEIPFEILEVTVMDNSQLASYCGPTVASQRGLVKFFETPQKVDWAVFGASAGQGLIFTVRNLSDLEGVLHIYCKGVQTDYDLIGIKHSLKEEIIKNNVIKINNFNNEIDKLLYQLKVLKKINYSSSKFVEIFGNIYAKPGEKQVIKISAQRAGFIKPAEIQMYALDEKGERSISFEIINISVMGNTQLSNYQGTVDTNRVTTKFFESSKSVDWDVFGSCYGHELTIEVENISNIEGKLYVRVKGYPQES